jgi:hypothetical protein
MLMADASNGTSQLHRGTLNADGGVTWDSDSPTTIDQPEYIASTISAGPNGLLAMGWNVMNLAPAAWASTDGTAWQRLDVASDILGGAITHEPEWSSAGWVSVGAADSSAVGGVGALGVGQRLWTSSDGATWTPVGEPIAYGGPPAPCPSPSEVTTLILVFLGSMAEDCFADATLTIRGWSPEPQGVGGCCFPDPDPVWLAAAFPAGWLMPTEPGELGSPTLSLHVPPNVDAGGINGDAWIEVVGHFRDPASVTCTHTPNPTVNVPLAAPQHVVRICEQRFVVESVRVVDGP